MCRQTLKDMTLLLPLTCSANAMDIIFNIIRHIKVNHYTDILHIESSCCHVSSNKHGESSFLELCQGRVTLIEEVEKVEEVEMEVVDEGVEGSECISLSQQLYHS